jgi:hypothetical protein
MISCTGVHAALLTTDTHILLFFYRCIMFNTLKVTMNIRIRSVLIYVIAFIVSSFVLGYAPTQQQHHRRNTITKKCRQLSTNQIQYCHSHSHNLLSLKGKGDGVDEEWSDFDGFVGGGGGGGNESLESKSNKRTDNDNFDSVDFLQLFQERSGSIDLTSCQTRQFSLGQDLVLSDYVGNMGFDEVTDWEYYYQAEDDPDERQVVQPNPFDSSL